MFISVAWIGKGYIMSRVDLGLSVAGRALCLVAIILLANYGADIGALASKDREPHGEDSSQLKKISEIFRSQGQETSELKRANLVKRNAQLDLANQPADITDDSSDDSAGDSGDATSGSPEETSPTSFDYSDDIDSPATLPDPPPRRGLPIPLVSSNRFRNNLTNGDSSVIRPSRQTEDQSGRRGQANVGLQSPLQPKQQSGPSSLMQVTSNTRRPPPDQPNPPGSLTTPLYVRRVVELPSTNAASLRSNQSRQQQQQQQQPYSQRSGMHDLVPLSTFNVDMGADRMLIKPHQQQHQNHQANTPQPYTTTMTTRSNIFTEPELATESINHELFSQANGNSGSVMVVPENERRQDLLYPSNANPNGGSPYLATRMPSADQLDAQQSTPTICYTPLALLMVILVTMMITVVVCFSVHILIKHLGRHQFDLIENSKQFDTKHGSGYLQGAAERRFPLQDCSPMLGRKGDLADKQLCMLSLFQGQSGAGAEIGAAAEGHRRSQGLRDERGCAFDNPYFRDEAGAYQQRQACVNPSRPMGTQQTAGLLATGCLPSSRQKCAGEAPLSSEQLYFIEHHISNLHSRQVTSSVNELSILGSPGATSPGQVVDLTSEEQRAKIIADPREGDLIAVDITGHDFIGLGFDVCGNSRDGIFIKSVLARGPARESGCIQAGDRIKCLNVNFDNMTLQDACDILNCGSPYKMRLLLEKQAAPAKLTDKLRSPTGPKAQKHRSRSFAPESHRQPYGRDEGTGPASATRTYIRRLAELVSPGGNKASSRGQTYRSQFGTQTPSFISSEQRPIEHARFGSVAARRPPSNNSSLLPSGAHTNAGFASETDLNSNRSRCQSHGNSLDMRDRYSVDSAETFGSYSATNDLAEPDSSLDYTNRNVNHPLHGPPMFEHQSRACNVADLRLTSSRDPTSSNKLPVSRRQSIASSSAALNERANAGVDQHLVQTQSQPGIAMDQTDGVTTDGSPNSKGERPTEKSRRSPMMSSVSTPTMNLLTSSSSDQPIADWRRVSSRRRKRESRESIREETAGSSDNSFTDSTSKLVANNSRGKVIAREDVNESDSTQISTTRPTGDHSPADGSTRTATTDRRAQAVNDRDLTQSHMVEPDRQ